MSKYKIIAQQIILDQPWAKVVMDTLEYQGKQRQYYFLISPVESVATVGLTDDLKIILTYQYRHPVQKFIYDLPAGGLHPGEGPMEGARREFEEETGFYPQKIEKIGYFNQFPGSMRAGTHLFFASNLVPTRQNLDPGEELEIVFISIEDTLALITQGEVIDGSLQLGVLLAVQMGLIPV